MKGQVHVYTGNGKGKTTAALGLALRAAGAGKKVYIGQFVKSMEYSEIKAIKRYLSDCIDVVLYGNGCFIGKNPEQADIDAAKSGLREAAIALASGKYGLVVLDEANIATYFGLITPGELLDAVDKRHGSTEVVLTGRYASDEVVEEADLVTEMQEVRHYYAKGILSREGIDR